MEIVQNWNNCSACYETCRVTEKEPFLFVYVHNNKVNMMVQKGSTGDKIIEEYHFLTLQFVIKLWTQE